MKFDWVLFIEFVCFDILTNLFYVGSQDNLKERGNVLYAVMIYDLLIIAQCEIITNV